MALAHETFGIPYHEYLQRCNEYQRQAYLDYANLRNIKTAFSYVPDDKKHEFLRDKLGIVPDMPELSLTQLIEHSIQLQRQENEEQERQAKLNGHQRRRMAKAQR